LGLAFRSGQRSIPQQRSIPLTRRLFMGQAQSTDASMSTAGPITKLLQHSGS